MTRPSPEESSEDQRPPLIGIYACTVSSTTTTTQQQHNPEHACGGAITVVTVRKSRQDAKTKRKMLQCRASQLAGLRLVLASASPRRRQILSELVWFHLTSLLLSREGQIWECD
jgi:hypothetical protein